MQSQSGLSQFGIFERSKHFAAKKWESLTDGQKSIAKRVWGIITYKWKWQIAMNIPYLAIFLLDRTIPAVHQFNIALLAMVTSRLPIPSFISLCLSPPLLLRFPPPPGAPHDVPSQTPLGVAFIHDCWLSKLL